jgi:mono/diheme cytochrome c family protein
MGGMGGGRMGQGGMGGGREGGGRMARGPDLSKTGSDPKHTRQWFIELINNPQSKKERARMPKFGEKLKAEEIGKIADYLGSLKG